ncbi:TPA: hypothetical protein ACPZQ5_002646 [Yersinia enterocolitica]
MKELNGFTVERLEELTALSFPPSHHELAALARIALAAKRAEESHSRREVWDGGNTWIQCSRQAYDRHEAAGKRVRVLYERPQLNSPEIPEDWKLVPIEPTLAMLTLLGLTGSFESMLERYANMLDAAPERENG